MGGVWNLVFGRYLNDWEMEEVQNLFYLINLRRINQLEKDGICWQGNKSLYTLLRQG